MRVPGGLRPTVAGLVCMVVLMPAITRSKPSINWLSLAKNSSPWNQTKHCMAWRGERGLSKTQVGICRNYLELMAVTAHAARETVRVCEELFHQRRWNCSSINYAPTFRADLTGGSREQAYVYSLSSAALTQAVSKACAVGVTTKCSCGLLPAEAPPKDFKWGGCGDDLRFGLAFSRKFAESEGKRDSRPGTRISKRSMVNAHNNNAGRLVVEASLSTACKCHGVSGSCSIKTCWKGLPDMRSVGIELQKRYAVAIEVDSKRIRKSRKRKENEEEKSRQRRLVAISGHKKSFKSSDLIYYTKSSDYCLPDESLGSQGTRGRRCEKDNPGSIGCRSMCCGRGYTSETRDIRQRCDCKYYWCCYVKCKTCIQKVELNQCR